MNVISIILFALAGIVFLLDMVQYGTSRVKLLSFGLLLLTGGFIAQFVWQNWPIVVH